MEKKKNVFDICGQILMIFGFSVLCVMLLCALLGQSAKGYSSMFDLGSEGLTLTTLFQYLLISTVIVLLRQLFFTDIVIKNLGMPLRVAGMFGSVIAVMVACVWIFDWFPVNDIVPWIMFLICFLVCTLGSIGVVSLKDKVENRKIQEALQKMQEGSEEWNQ